MDFAEYRRRKHIETQKKLHDKMRKDLMAKQMQLVKSEQLDISRDGMVVFNHFYDTKQNSVSC